MRPTLSRTRNPQAGYGGRVGGEAPRDRRRDPRECASARDGVRQVVVINAGFGTRPYRNALPDVTWFEVRRHGPGASPAKRHLIPRLAAGGEKRKLPRGARRGGRPGPPRGLEARTRRSRTSPRPPYAKSSSSGSTSRRSFHQNRNATRRRIAIRRRARSNRLAAVLKTQASSARSPCVFVVEDALTHLEPLEARCLMRSLNGLAAPGSVLVVAGIPRRVARWARRRAKAALGRARARAVGGFRRDAFGGDRVEMALRFERAVPKHARPSFRVWVGANGWARIRVLQPGDARARARRGGGPGRAPRRRRARRRVQKETARVFRRARRAGVWFFPVRPKTYASACAPRVLRKTPILSGVFRTRTSRTSKGTATRSAR